MRGILPELTAWHGEEELNVEYMGAHTAMDIGFFAPSADERYPLPEHWGVDALLEDVPEVDSVKWRYALKMFTPNAPLVVAPAWWFDEDVDEAWEQSIRDIHNDGKIAVVNGTGIHTWQQAQVRHDLYEIIAMTIAAVIGNCDGSVPLASAAP